RQAPIDRQLVGYLTRAHVSFCVIGDLARAVLGCPARDGKVELLTVDTDVLRPLFWEDFRALTVLLGGDDDPWLGRLRWDGTPSHELIVGRGHTMVFTANTAKEQEDLGCRVATALGLVLLALERGGTAGVAEVHELVRAESARLGRPWRPPVEEHLPHMSAGAAASWHKLSIGLGS